MNSNKKSDTIFYSFKEINSDMKSFKSNRKLSDEVFYDLFEKEIDVIFNKRNIKKKNIIFFKSLNIFFKRKDFVEKEIKVLIEYFGFKYFTNLSVLKFIGFLDKFLFKRKNNKNFIQINKIKLLCSFLLINDFIKKKDKEKIEKIDKKLFFNLVIKENIKIYFLNQFHSFSNPILYFKISDIKISIEEKIQKINFILQIFLKSYNFQDFEPFLENIDFSITKKTEEKLKKIIIKTSKLNLNLKINLFESLLQIMKIIKFPKHLTYRFSKIIIYNKLQKKIDLEFQNKKYSIKNVLEEISIDENKLIITCYTDISQILEGDLLKSCLKILKEFKEKLGIFEIKKTMDNNKLKYKTFDETILKIKLQQKFFEIDLNKQNQNSIWIEKPYYCLNIQNSFYNGFHHISLCSNIIFINKTDFPIYLNFFKKKKIFKQKKNILKSGSLGNFKDGIFRKNKDFDFCYEVLYGAKLNIFESYCVPFLEDFENIFIKINFKFENQPKNLVNLYKLFKKKNFSIKIESGFDKKKNDKKYEYLFLKCKNISKKNEINYEMNILPPLILKNNLPSDLLLFFKEKKIDIIESISKTNQSLNLNENINFNKNLKKIKLGEFSENNNYDFIAKNYPLLFINNYSRGEDFIDLIEKQEKEIFEEFQDLKNNENFEEIIEKENYKKNLITALYFDYSKELTNIIVWLKKRNDQIKIYFSAEIFFINETNLKLSFFVKERNYFYEKINLDNLKFEKIIRLLNSENENCNNNSVLSFYDFEENYNLSKLLKKSSNYIKIFSGDPDLFYKNIIIEEKNHKKKIIEISKQNDFSKLIIIEKELILISLINKKKNRDLNNIIIFHYPFYIINKLKSDIVIKKLKITERYVILPENRYFSSSQIFGESKIFCCDFHIKINSNEYNWSSSFFIDLYDILEGDYFLKIKSCSKYSKNQNVLISFQKSQLSTIIEIRENMNFHIKIKNNLNSSLFFSQFQKDDIKEIVHSKSEKDYFWDNTFHTKKLNLYKKRDNKYIFINEIDFENTDFEENIIFIRDWELDIIRLKINENNDFFILNIDNFIEENSSILSSSTFKLTNFFRRNMKFSNYAIKLKNKLVKKQEEKNIFDFKWNFGEINISICSENPQEIFFLYIENSNFSFISEKYTNKKDYFIFNYDFEFFQFDTQLDYVNHNNFLIQEKESKRKFEIKLEIFSKKFEDQLILNINLPHIKIYLNDNWLIFFLDYIKDLKEFINNSKEIINKIFNSESNRKKLKKLKLKSLKISQINLSIMLIEMKNIIKIFKNKKLVKLFLNLLQNLGIIYLKINPFYQKNILSKIDLKKKIDKFYKKELKEQFLVLNNKEIKRIFIKVFNYLSFHFLNKIYNLDINPPNKEFQYEDLLTVIKNIGVKLYNISITNKNKNLQNKEKNFKSVLNCIKKKDYLNYMEINNDLIKFDNFKIIFQLEEKLKNYSIIPHFDFEKPKRIPRAFINKKMFIYSKNISRLFFIFGEEIVKKGNFFEINNDFLFFVCKDFFLVFYDKVHFPKFKIKLKNVIKIDFKDEIFFVNYIFYDVDDFPFYKTFFLPLGNYKEKTIKEFFKSVFLKDKV